MLNQIMAIVQHSPLLITVPLLSAIGLLTITFFNKDNHEAEIELDILDKLKFKLRTKK